MQKKQDYLKWIRDIRKKHYEETKNMTTKERFEYDKQSAKKFEEWLKNRKK
jgi:hypothetical protein